MAKARMLFFCGLAAVLAVCFSCTMWRAKPPTSWSSATAAEQFERLIWRDVKDRRWREVEGHLAPTFVSLYAGGTRDRAATVDYLKSLVLTDYVLGDFNTATDGADMIVTYTARVAGTYKGQSLPSEPVRMMTVWQQVAKNWVAIAHSEILASDLR